MGGINIHDVNIVKNNFAKMTLASSQFTNCRRCASRSYLLLIRFPLGCILSLNFRCMHPYDKKSHGIVNSAKPKDAL